MNKPKRVAVIGLDCALTHLIDTHIAEGYLPTFKKLFEGGVVADECLVPYPTVTPPNWATIATGALIGTHQVVDFHVPLPGTTPDNEHIVQAFSSERCEAEYVWDAADRAGKKCIVLNYPGAWPNHMKNGVVVAGAGLTPGENRDGFPRMEHTISLCGNQVVSTGFYPGGIRGTFESATGWQNLREEGEEPLELAAELNFPHADAVVAPTTWHVLARQSGDGGYDTITLSPTKDMNDAFFTIHPGEWSPKVWTKIRMADGSEREVFFKAKLLELSEDAEDFRLLITGLSDITPWCSPVELAEKIKATDAVPVASCGLVEYSLGIIDGDTYAECSELYTRWLADTTLALFKEIPDWDAFFMHCHPPDYTYHGFMTAMDPEFTKDEAKRAKAWEVHRRVYQAQDELIARIAEAAGEDALIVLVSDHGAVPDAPPFDPYKALVPAGLSVVGQGERLKAVGRLEEGFTKFMGTKTNPALSKVLASRVEHLYINLKGRDPEGIVEPEDFEKVQQQAIDALYTHVDPDSGRRPVALALSKQDARILGLYGEKVGDVVYAIYPWFGSQHGNILPTARWGIGDLRALWAFYGPGIKKGARLQRTVGLEDLVPTICYLTGLPLPKDAEGAVIFQAFEDPDFKRKEVVKLTEALIEMEAALSRKQA